MDIKNSLLSVVVPCFNEEDNIIPFYEEFIKNECFFKENDIRFEIIFVDDGSEDSTEDRIKELNMKDRRVGLISLSGNAGKEASIYAGIKESSGSFVCVMDVDLQDPPSLLPYMFTCINEGYDQAAARRMTRDGEPVIRSWCAVRFYHLLNKVSGMDIPDGARDFRLMTRRTADAYLSAGDSMMRYSKEIFEWTGFKTKWISYENEERKHGISGWSFASLVKYALDGLLASSSSLFIISLIIAVISFIAGMITFAVCIMMSVSGSSMTSMMAVLCVMLFINSFQMVFISLAGQYSMNAYRQSRGRPLYIRKELIKPDTDIKEEKKE